MTGAQYRQEMRVAGVAAIHDEFLPSGKAQDCVVVCVRGLDTFEVRQVESAFAQGPSADLDSRLSQRRAERGEVDRKSDGQHADCRGRIGKNQQVSGIAMILRV